MRVIRKHFRQEPPMSLEDFAEKYKLTLVIERVCGGYAAYFKELGFEYKADTFPYDSPQSAVESLANILGWHVQARRAWSLRRYVPIPRELTVEGMY